MGGHGTGHYVIHGGPWEWGLVALWGSMVMALWVARVVGSMSSMDPLPVIRYTL